MKFHKKKIREEFRNACLTRDKHTCRMCGYVPRESFVKDVSYLEVHHITDRTEMPNGGYVAENGISLCPDCHLKAEMFHQVGKAYPGYSPEDLYNIIGSNKELAIKESEKI